MLCAQVLSRAVTECLSGSCSSLEVIHRCTDCRKGLASATEQRALSTVPGPWPTQANSWGGGVAAFSGTGLASVISGAFHPAMATCDVISQTLLVA